MAGFSRSGRLTLSLVSAVGLLVLGIGISAPAAYASVTVPGAPTGLKATPGNAAAVVKWTAPANNGGSAITGYTVTTTPGSKTCTTTGAKTCTVHSLTNGTTYTVSVKAKNAKGFGAASAHVTVKVGVPLAPTFSLFTQAISANARLTIKWVAAVNNGSAITKYTVTATPGPKSCTTTGALMCTLTGLSNSQVYTVRVTATNAKGTSAPSVALVLAPQPPLSGTAVNLNSDDDFSFCAVTTTSQVACWGNWFQTDVPLPVRALPSAVSVANDGNGSYCAVLVSGGVDCWGLGQFGALGDGTTASSEFAVSTGITNATSVVANQDGHSFCALLATGSVNCWGYNNGGQLGNGTFANSDIPVSTGITNASSLIGLYEAGTGGYCAILSTTGVDCWGAGFSDIPIAIENPDDTGPLSGAVSLSTLGDATCALLTSGSINCWGYDGSGELGDGGVNTGGTAVVSGITTAVSLSGGVGNGTFCAVLSSGAVECWGIGSSGQLGNGTTTPVAYVPVPVTGITDAASVTANYLSFCAVLTSGGVDCWGDNTFGELGTGSTTDSDLPVATGITTGSAVAGSADSQSATTCVLLTSGGVDCWGTGDVGELGNGASTDSETPVSVSGL